MTKSSYPRLHTLKYEIAPQYVVNYSLVEDTDSSKADNSENDSPNQ